MSKLTVKELAYIKQDELTKILKKEGDSPCAEPKHSEWLDVFELMRMCNRSGLSELETWCVLRSRFNIDHKSLVDERNEKLETILA